MRIRTRFASLITSLILSGSVPLAAQTLDRLSFRTTDSLVMARGSMADSSLRSIVRHITPLCQSQACQLRAIYMWVSKNISYDCAGSRHPEQVNNSASYVLANRTAVSKGYAVLVAEMCRIAGITCEVVSGVARRDPDDIGRVDNKKQAASWNVARAGDRWFVIDAAWGAGYCDRREFVPELTDAWFLTNRKLFALCHYPANKRWQLLDTPIERSAFAQAPVIGPVSSIIGLLPAGGQRGLLRGRQDSSVRIALTLKAAEEVLTMLVVSDGITTPVQFDRAGDQLSVTIPYPKSGKYPIGLLINTTSISNGGPAFIFRAEVTAKAKRTVRK